MLLTAASIATAATILGLAWQRRNQRVESAARLLRHRACVDAEAIDELIGLVQRLSSGGSDTDALASRLLRLYRTFPPTERHMQALSMLQQEYAGTGGLEEFVATTVCGVAMISFARGDSPDVAEVPTTLFDYSKRRCLRRARTDEGKG